MFDTLCNVIEVCLTYLQLQEGTRAGTDANETGHAIVPECAV